MNGGENKIVTHSATQLPNGGKQPVSNKLVIAVVSLAILTFLGILSETSLNIAYSTPMEEFSIGASVVQWLVTGYLLLLSVSIPSSPFMVRKFATKTLFIMAIVIFTAGTLLGALAVNFPMLLEERRLQRALRRMDERDEYEAALAKGMVGRDKIGRASCRERV